MRPILRVGGLFAPETPRVDVRKLVHGRETRAHRLDRHFQFARFCFAFCYRIGRLGDCPQRALRFVCQLSDCFNRPPKHLCFFQMHLI